MKFLSLILILLLIIILAACGGTSQATSIPATATPSIVTPTNLPAPSVQPQSTNTVRPTSALSLSSPTIISSPVVTPTSQPSTTLLVTNSAGRHISLVDPNKGVLDKIEVGAAPWGMALASDGKVFVATAEGVAVVDVKNRRRLALVPYRATIGQLQFGEYRPGGMGIAASPDGKFVYIGVHLASSPDQLEILEVEKSAIVASVPVGVRPFQVLVSRDGKEVYSIDHDSYSVTVVDPVKLTTRPLNIAALGRGSFDKAHYAALASDGHLLLPIQGRVLVDLDPNTGKFTTAPLSASTHQHGVAFSPDNKKLFIVGTGPAGGVTGKPGLTIRDMATGSEEIIPLARPHENVAISPDGQWAYLTGGYSFNNEGWDGLTIINLQTRSISELPVPERPFDILTLLSY